jgi:hypothetical protein
VNSPPSSTVDRQATYETNHALHPPPWSGASVESKAAPPGPAAPSFRLCLLLAALIVFAGYVARVRLINGSMPYPMHLDEQRMEAAENVSSQGRFKSCMKGAAEFRRATRTPRSTS